MMFRRCQWPVNKLDPRDMTDAQLLCGSWQCGAPALPGQPYCARHLAMAYGGGEPLEDAEDAA